MIAKRVIARLDIKGPNLVKGIHLEGLRVLGSPEEFAHRYFDQGADEIVYMDVVASLYERNSLHDTIERTAKDVFIPLSVGGGIRSISDINSCLRAGADKVIINTAAVRNPKFVRDAVESFGSSTISIAIEAIKHDDGQYYAYTDNGREPTNREVRSWAVEVTKLGAGEIMITSVDREGSGKGFDLDLIKLVADAVDVPVIAHGGGGTAEHVADLFRSADCAGGAMASMFHYDLLLRNEVDIGRSAFASKETIEEIIGSCAFTPTSITRVKEYLHAASIPCRYIVRGN